MRICLIEDGLELGRGLQSALQDVGQEVPQALPDPFVKKEYFSTYTRTVLSTVL